MAGNQVESLRAPTTFPRRNGALAPVSGLRDGVVSARHGFSLIDLLVSIAVITVLIGLLMPSVAQVREAARRVICASNVRQHGLGIAMYADDFHGFLPYSKYSNVARSSSQQYQPELTTMLRSEDDPGQWDGLGVMFAQEYIDAPGVFYCPSHHGQHYFADYASQWAGAVGRIEGNYQYRGTSSLRYDDLPSGHAMIPDALRSQIDYSHKVGSNVLRSDFAVAWFSDASGQMAAGLPAMEGDSGAAGKVETAWRVIDSGVSNSR